MYNQCVVRTRRDIQAAPVWTTGAIAQVVLQTVPIRSIDAVLQTVPIRTVQALLQTISVRSVQAIFQTVPVM